MLVHVAKAGREEREMVGNTGAEEECPTKAGCCRHGAFLAAGRRVGPYYQLFPSSLALGAPVSWCGTGRKQQRNQIVGLFLRTFSAQPLGFPCSD